LIVSIGTKRLAELIVGEKNIMRSKAKALTISLAIISSISLQSVLANETWKKQNSHSRVAKTDNLNYSQIVNEDVTRFQNFFVKKFPNVEFEEFNNGVYAIDSESREQWIEMEDFPPYELAVDEGKILFEQKFDNGKSYADCFPDFKKGVRQNYPRFDQKTNQVVTLELAINQCREANNTAPLAYDSEEITSISGYLAFLSRGNKFNLKVNSINAYNAYLAGKRFYYSKRGQLNFACSDCHIKITGTKLRADTVSPGLGHPTGMPVYRSKWGELGSIGRRYQECNKNVRAVPFDLQSEVYRNLEYFQTIMSNGLEVNGPSSRK
jgi:L-cysteine S-thiosulfotransferase